MSRIRSGRRKLSEAAMPWLAAAVGVIGVLIPFLTNRRFFFLDDKQNFFIPYAIDIATRLLHGELPFLTLSTVFGGNLAIDWQHGLLNPFSLLSYLLIYKVNDLEVAGALLAAAYMPLLSLGSYLLGRQYSLDRASALLFSAMVATNNFVIYWGAATWHNHLVGVVWFVWAWFFLQRIQDRHRYGLIGFIAGAYLVLTSGFVHAGVVLGLLSAVYLACAIGRRNWATAADIIVGGVVALLAVSPSLLPAFLTLSETTRPTSASNTTFLAPTLGDYLMLGAPAFFPKLKFWSGVDFHVPIFYLAWFIPALLPFVELRGLLRTHGGLTPLVIALVIILLLATGAENLGPLRWPFRYCLFVHLLTGILFLNFILRSGPLVVNARRAGVAFGLIAVISLAAILEEPAAWRANVYATVAVTLLTAVSVAVFQKRGKLALVVGLIASTFFLFVGTHLAIPRNADAPDFLAPATRSGSTSPALKPFSGYLLFLGGRLHQQVVEGVPEFSVAATGISKGEYTFNGHTPLAHKTLSAELCIGERTQTVCVDGVNSWTKPDAETGVPLLDLFRIVEVAAQYGIWRDELAPRLGSEWRSDGRAAAVEYFKRVVPITLPGTVSRLPTGISIETPEPMRHQGESLTVVENPAGGRMIFARLFWPGYRATLNGEPLDVVAHRGFLVAIDLPPGTTGRLELWFRPPGLRLGLLLAAMGALLFATYLWLSALLSRRDADKRQPARPLRNEVANEGQG